MITGFLQYQLLAVILVTVIILPQFIIRRYQRPAVLLHSPLLLGELLPQHGQLGFRARDGLFVVLYASSGQRSGWTRLP